MTDLKVNRDSYLRKIDGLIIGEDPKQGFVENNAFYHPVLKIQFPILTDLGTSKFSPQFPNGRPKKRCAIMMLTLGISWSNR